LLESEYKKSIEIDKLKYLKGELWNIQNR
jgi:hypothetical protein